MTCPFARFDVFGRGCDTVLTTSDERQVYIRVDEYESNNQLVFQEGKYFVKVLVDGVYTVAVNTYLDFDEYEDLKVALVNTTKSEVLSDAITKTESNSSIDWTGNLAAGDCLAICITQVCSCDKVKAKQLCTVKLSFNINNCDEIVEA